MTKRIGVVAVFLAGCAVGGASSQLVVPKASAQQAATLPKWEMFCIAPNDGASAVNVSRAAERLGPEGWEPVGGNNYTWCWKRPKL